MSSVCLLILCGVPGAGKSTWVQHFISFIQTLNDNLGGMMSNNCHENDSDFGERQDKKATGNHYEVIHIAYDSLIDEELETQLIETSRNHSEEKNESDWKLCRKIIAAFVDQLIEELLSLEFPNQHFHQIFTKTDRVLSILSKNPADFGPLVEKLQIAFHDLVNRQMRKRSGSTRWVLVVDDNMYYASMRYEYFQIARRQMTGFAQVCFPVDLKTALNCNQARNRHVDDSVIVDMFKKLEMPSSENFWEKYSTTWTHKSADSESFFKVLDLIDEASRNPVKQIEDDTESVEESRTICSTNVLHQADIALRRILGLHLKEAKDSVKSKAEQTRIAALCNSARLQILEELRNQTVIIPLFDTKELNFENEFIAFLRDKFSQKLTALVT